MLASRWVSDRAVLLHSLLMFLPLLVPLSTIHTDIGGASSVYISFGRHSLIIDSALIPLCHGLGVFAKTLCGT